ncbi:DUF4383 domain-containing protein [Amycolatopsis acidiphila]|uniref:DUF4383 domain-containing protein n=1 Tax=Amycolatopsis acidiphila TaxID=715473 RepID=A0A558A8P6_9PSEU|nr:DUF4383 domain-containing protein [Amycolatopsis acidiphila]TVT20628.1 DUF4383 domain-containing protein [Amycolatopsis acidiphila]UIJ61374.1 DUF4383 domain-containing protein [Amycolatopsis acidiphila]GHG77984.1 hypothetical protein GCM10017788_44630 [Amycolatopsis acidiphila]
MARSKDAHIRVQGLQPVQVLAGLVGLAYLALGIVGFARTGLGDFAGHQDVMLLGFMINPLHNLVHVVVGVLGLLTATYSGLARTFGWVLFIGFGLIAIWGLMITGVIASNPVSNLGNPLNLNDSDNWLHIATAVLGLIIAIMPARKVVHVVEPEPATTVAPSTTAETEPLRTGAHETPARTDATPVRSEVNAPEGARSPEVPGERRRASSWLRGRSHHTTAH